MAPTLDTLLNTLNEQQRVAVEAPPGPILVLAGAGSGKTRVLTHRVAYFVRHRQIPPWQILAVTFTNRAAGEMRARVHRLTEAGDEDVMVTTFHALCARILRRNIEKLGYNSRYVIYDAGDQKTLLKRIVSDMKLPKATHDPRIFRAMIDRAKNLLQWPEDIVPPTSGPLTRLPEVYAAYQKRLFAANAVDFGDLLLITVRLLERHEDVRLEYHRRYQHLLIDEYQDTNHAQYRLAQLLMNQDTRSLCVVGDEDQSIYGFRGADINNILSFNKDFPDATVIKLEQNYRSTGNILSAAGAVVAHNEERLGKSLWTDQGDGEPLHYMETGNDIEEASRVAEEILRLRAAHGVQYGDVAIFYRANHQSRLFEEAFNLRGTPYLLVGVGFYDRKEVKDIRAYLQLIYNPKDDASLDRIINTPTRGIGQKAQLYLYERAMAAGISNWEQLQRITAHPQEHGSAGRRLGKFFQLMSELRLQADHLKVRELIQEILEKTGYRDKLVQAEDVESESRLENLRELITVAAEYDGEPGMVGLERFLETISLHSQTDEMDELEGRVTLMTLHNAKGLEFPVVFMVGMEDGVFPHSRTLDTAFELEEERRLCYVGLTRAMKRLYLVRARQRRWQGEKRLTRPSRFLKEIPQGLMAGRRGRAVGDLVQRYGMGRDGGAGARGRSDSGRRAASSAGPEGALPQAAAWLSKRGVDMDTATSKGRAVEGAWGGAITLDVPLPSLASSGDEGPFRDLQVGRRVSHPSFGDGIIKVRQGPDDNPRLTIQFKGFGQKKLMARYAALELIYSG